ncbi:hypothetical protein PVAP13_6NG263400 [Panicum virgatum]|uniref:F-box domain-containing protein n=1 Tax=Panicum virgatum TaxID=38727 RepID=A0A8T0R3M7_PANVG|nr:hypothetical protein PVAP13_6NG263400 [Panicum virgatum]
MADEGFDVPTDAFVEILLRLPTSARRRFRLVCKRWRDVIDERTPERQVRTKTLAFIGPWRSPRALVFDDTDGRRSHEWAYPSAHEVVSMVGTCNGLICLLDAGEGGRSALRLTVANPVTGEALALPPLPAAWGLPGLHAFGCNLFCGIVAVDGSVYWFTSCADRVMALDLKDECVTSFPGPPGVRRVAVTGQASWKLTNVHARRGVAVPRYEPAGVRVEVWVLDGGGGEGRARWSRRYNLFETGLILMRPHLTHGEYVLSRSLDGRRLYRRKVGGGTDADDEGATPTRPSEGAELLTSELLPRDGLVTLAYAETREPLPSIRG